MNGNTSQVQGLSCLQTARWRSWASSCHSPMSILSVSPVKVLIAAAAAAKSHQSCLTLCDPIDGSPPGSPVPGILQAGKNTGMGCHFLLWCIKVKSESEVAQSHSTLRDPMDCSLPGSSVHGSFQARVLEWVASAARGKKKPTRSNQ